MQDKKQKKDLNLIIEPEPSNNEKAKLGAMDLEGDVLLRWKGNPWLARPKKLMALLMAFFLLFLFLIWAAPELGVFLVLFPFLLLGCESNHLMISEFAITTKGIYQKNLGTQLFKPWESIKCASFTDEAGEIIFTITSFRSRFQQNMVIYYDDNRNEIERLVQEYRNKSNAEGRKK